MRKCIQAVMIAGALLALAAEAALARMFVVASDAPAYRRQQIIEPAETLAIPPGKRIRVMLPDGTTRELSSADNGPAAKILQPVKATSWWEEVLDLVRSGGGTTRPGSTRAATPNTPVPTHYTLGGVSGGQFALCIEPGQRPELTRDKVESAQVVTFLAEATEKRITTDLAAGQSSLAWPADLAIGDRQVFRVVPANAQPMQVEMRVVARGLAGEPRLQAFAAAGCTAQAAEALKRLAQ